ncbi:MAG: hypothetical protein RR049_02210, partial [Angelakisella sp.]
MNKNAYEIFDQKVKSRQSYLQNDMIRHWSNIDEAVYSINSDWEMLRDGGFTSDDILADRSATDKFLMDISHEVIYTLRKNSVTGAFIILDQPITESGSIVSRPGLYVRDPSPESSAKDNSDLAIKYGSAALYRYLGITTDISWTPRVSFNAETPELNAYFDLPMEAAHKYSKLATADLGYWSLPIISDESSHPVFTYTVPLRDSTGEAYGILGIEISADYLKKLLPPYELNADNRASYCIARSTGDSDHFCVAASTGMFLKPYASDGTMLTSSTTVDADGCYQIDDSSKAKVYVSTQYLQLYNSGTPFAADKWALLGIVN